MAFYVHYCENSCGWGRQSDALVGVMDIQLPALLRLLNDRRTLNLPLSLLRLLLQRHLPPIDQLCVHLGAMISVIELEKTGFVEVFEVL